MQPAFRKEPDGRKLFSRSAQPFPIRKDGRLYEVCLQPQALVDATGNVQRAVSGKSTLPALEGILLRASGSSLFLAGYDLDLGITTTIEAQVQEPGEMVLTAKLFGEIVRRLPEEQVWFTADEKCNVVIKSGQSEFTIMGISASEYPGTAVC